MSVRVLVLELVLAATFAITPVHAAEPSARAEVARATPANTEPASRGGRSTLPARTRPSRADAPVVACSFSAPVCVHASSAVAGASILRALSSAEHVFHALTALGLPLPLTDGVLGGDPRYDLYLIDSDITPTTVADDMGTELSYDRTSAFSVLSPPNLASGCEADAAIARLLGHAVVLRFDAGAEGGAIAMFSSLLASTVIDCGVVDTEAIDDFQRMPELSLANGSSRGDPDQSTGSFLFARYLDDMYGQGVPGAVLLGLLSVSGQRTEASALHYANEPDVFDALRNNARARDKLFEDLLLDFAIARAFVGSRSDGAHISDVDRYGYFGRPRFEWAISYDTLPRRLAPLRPIEALGSTYLWLDLGGASADAELTFVADWELGVFFHWALVKVDAAGMELGRVSIAGMNGATHAERSIRDLRGVAGLFVVGVNVGSIDRSHPFDPDEGPELPRSYTVTLIR